MKSRGLHPVRFSEEQVEFIDLMIHSKAIEFWETECRDILSTIEKSKRKSKNLLTEGKTLSNVKNPPTTNLRPISPPGQGRAKSK